MVAEVINVISAGRSAAVTPASQLTSPGGPGVGVSVGESVGVSDGVAVAVSPTDGVTDPLGGADTVGVAAVVLVRVGVPVGVGEGVPGVRVRVGVAGVGVGDTHAGETGKCRHPRMGSHESVVHTSPSSQFSN